MMVTVRRINVSTMALTLLALLGVAVLTLVFADASWAQGSGSGGSGGSGGFGESGGGGAGGGGGGADPGAGLSELLRETALKVFGGLVAVVALLFLVQRKLKELVVFLAVALMVGWMVLSPEGVGTAGRDLMERIFGGGAGGSGGSGGGGE
jgi:uncharacterized membrane protein YgcG